MALGAFSFAVSVLRRVTVSAAKLQACDQSDNRQGGDEHELFGGLIRRQGDGRDPPSEIDPGPLDRASEDHAFDKAASPGSRRTAMPPCLNLSKPLPGGPIGRTVTERTRSPSKFSPSPCNRRVGGGVWCVPSLSARI